MKKDSRQIGKYAAAHRRQKRRRTLVTSMAAVVVFCTVYALILPAITLEAETYCGLEEHTHSEKCYTSRLVCGLEENSAHVHDDSCYVNQKTLICGMEESNGHTHDENCTQRTPICTEDHEHTDACFETTYICGLEQSEPHHHTDACYQTERVVTCTASTESHTHTDSCYESALTCPLEAHTHTLACYSDPQADIETEATWGKAASKVDLTGNWSADLVTVAESQRAYEESAKNYRVETDEVTGEEIKKGYTRYGAWYNAKYNGDPYADWSAMFLSFCLEYANVPEEDFPREAATETWRRKLSGDWEGYEDCHFYTKAQDHTPAPGQIVFLDENENQKSDRVVLVTELTFDETEETPILIGFKTIGGDVSLPAYPDAADAVDVEEFELTDSAILGYATLPENPDREEDPSLVSTAPETETLPGLTEEEAAQVNDIIARIDALPSLEQLREALAAQAETANTQPETANTQPETADTQPETANTQPEVAPQTDGGADRMETEHIPASASAFPEDTAEGAVSVSQEVSRLYAEYDSLTEQQQAAVTNADKLLILAQELGLAEEQTFCGLTPHTHGETCYDEAGNLTCAVEVHTHTLSCFSNPAADMETAQDWEAAFADMELSGFYTDDLLAVANTQLGYTESAKNYQVQEDGETVKGYTRYSHWYGGMETAYDDWDAMFVSFCLNYAGVPEEVFPRSATCPEWIAALESLKRYRAASPEKGNLVFFDTDSDGNADRVGIVSQLTYAEAAPEETDPQEAVPQLTGFACIQGDINGAVAIQDYTMDDTAILGYGKLPKWQKSMEEKGPDYTITVRYTDAAELPEDTQLVVSEILPGTEAYDTYASLAAKAMEEEVGQVTRRFFDITLISGEGEEAKEVEPAAPVNVTISLAEAQPTGDDTVVHFTQEGEVETLPATADESGVHYEQPSFSVSGVSVASNSVAGRYTATNGTIYLPMTSIKENVPYAILGCNLINAVTKEESSLNVTKNSVTYSSGLATAMIGPDLTGDEIQTYCFWYFESATDSKSNAGYKIYTYKNAADGTKTKKYLRLTDITQPFNGDIMTIMNILALDGTVDTATVFFLESADSSSGRVRLRAPYDHSWFLGMCVDGIRTTVDGNDTTNDTDSAYTGSFTGYTTRTFDNTALYLYTGVYTVDTVSPSSTAISLFDYRVNINSTDWRENGESTITGINTGHALQFNGGNSGNVGTINRWTQTDGGVLQGIVSQQLGDGGYPVLSGNGNIITNDNGSKTESLSYLFNKNNLSDTNGKEYKRAYSNVQGLLQVDSEGYFYYNSQQNYAEYNAESNRFNVYSDWAVTGTTDGQFFPFNAYSTVGKTTSRDASFLNHHFGMMLTTRFIQGHNGYADANHKQRTTFEFSGDDDVWIFIDDVLVADLGGIHSAESVTIDFAAGTVKISKVYGQNGTNIETKFSDIFSGTNVELATYDGNTTLKNGTTHTLKFFYLERGGSSSNLMLKFNLTEIPPTSIYKVNQYGDALGGATFAVYAADANWNYLTDKDSATKVKIPQNATGVTFDSNWNMIYGGTTFKALYCGTTNENGEMVFLDADGMPYSLSELQQMFGDHFILREVAVPNGYRTVSDDTYLYIEGGLLQTADPYGTGVWASPNAMITATNTLYVANTSTAVAQTLTDSTNENYDENVQTYTDAAGNTGYKINYYSPDSGSNGTLFAVVLKRNGQDGSATTLNGLNLSTWCPVYGSEDKGYEVLTPSETGNLAQAIEAARMNSSSTYNQNVTFSVAASGMQLLMENLPGKPERYYSYVYNQGKTVDASEPQYVVAYYWTTADSVYGATVNNTVRVASHENTTPVGDDGFDVQWGSTIQVPNVLNRLFFQKKNEAGELVNNAVFALYNVEEHAIKNATETDEKLIYYIGHGAEDTDTTKYWVALLDSDGSAANAEKAAVFREKPDGSAEIVGYGTYTINTQGWAAITEGAHAGRVTGDNIGRITVNVTHSDSGYTTAISDDKKVTVYVDPAMDVHNDYPLVGYTHDSCSVVSEDGTGHLSYLDEGCYYLREIAAPAGYIINTTSIPVYIDSTGVYANAGTSDNGVAVGNGVGYLVATMNTFASQGKIDESLTWVYGALIVNRANDFSAFSKDTGDTLTVYNTNWSFAKQVTGDKPSHASDIVEPSDSSAARSSAMVTYLLHTGDQPDTPEDIFDYSPTGDQTAREAVVDIEGNPPNPYPQAWVSTIAGQNDRRLYTTIGWSDMAIYQDYAYGYKQFTTGSTTNYDDLTGKGNLANLFSSSTFVEVTDLYIGIDKWVQEDSITEDPNSDLGWGETNDADIAQTVNFKTTIHARAGAKNYVVHDVMSDGLTFGSVTSITVGGDPLNPGEHYEVITPGTETGEGKTACTFEIRFSQTCLDTITTDTDIVVNYSAKLNADAVIGGAGNPDTVWLTYSSNSFTDPIITKTYTWDLDVFKFTSVRENGTDSEKPLAGAAFTLSKNANGSGPIGLILVTDGSAAVPKTANVYRVAMNSETDATEIITSDNGRITIQGLDSDDYYLTETAAPDGYNLLSSPISVKIDTDGSTHVISTSENGTSVDEVVNEVKVENKSSYELPETGGEGTVTMAVLGLAMVMIGAFGLVVLKKRGGAM